MLDPLLLKSSTYSLTSRDHGLFKTDDYSALEIVILTPVIEITSNFKVFWGIPQLFIRPPTRDLAERHALMMHIGTVHFIPAD